MQIDDSLSGANGVRALDATRSVDKTQGVSPERTASNAPQAGQPGGDTATLSAGATLASHLAQTGDVRMEKVAAVQQSLASGTYQVDAGKVADKIIASMLQKP